MAIIYITLKQCSRKDKCINPLGNWLPATSEYFHNRKNELRSRCKACTRSDNRIRNHATYHADIEAARAKGREEQKLFRKRHAEQVHEQDRVRRKKRHAENPEAEREKSRKKYQRQRKENPNALRAKSSRVRETRKIRLAEVADKGNYTAHDVDVQFRMQRGKCWWCSKKLKGEYHVDHRIPVSRGGSNAAENICIACPDCNLQKNAKMPWEWNGRLL